MTDTTHMDRILAAVAEWKARGAPPIATVNGSKIVDVAEWLVPARGPDGFEEARLQFITDFLSSLPVFTERPPADVAEFEENMNEGDAAGTSVGCSKLDLHGRTDLVSNVASGGIRALIAIRGLSWAKPGRPSLEFIIDEGEIFYTVAQVADELGITERMVRYAKTIEAAGLSPRVIDGEVTFTAALQMAKESSVDAISTGSQFPATPPFTPGDGGQGSSSTPATQKRNSHPSGASSLQVQATAVPVARSHLPASVHPKDPWWWQRPPRWRWDLRFMAWVLGFH